MRVKELMTVWDREPTDAELNRFYGSAPDCFEVAMAIERQANAIEAEDLAEVCHEFPLEVLAAIKTKNAYALLELFDKSIKESVARRASIEIYGDTGIINAAEVTL